MQLSKERDRRDAGPDTGEFAAFGDAHGTPEGPWGTPTTSPVVTGPPKARSGLVLVVAFVVEAVLIIVLGNQFAADKIAGTRPDSLMLTGVRNVALVFSWRVSPKGGHDTGHLWLAQTIALPSAVLLSLLLILTIIRGPITFWRAFFGTWMSVAVAAMVGGYVGGLIVDRGFAPGGQVVSARPSRAEQALFGVLAPGSVVFLAGVVLGLVVAFVVAIVARSTRRTPTSTLVPAAAESAPFIEPDAPPPYYPEQRGIADSSPWRDDRYGPPARDDRAASAASAAGAAGAATTALPSLDKDESGTTSQLPAVDADPAARTSAFARPAQDEAPAPTPTSDEASPPAATRREPDATQAMPTAAEPATDAPKAPTSSDATSAPAATPREPDATSAPAATRREPDATAAMPATRHEPDATQAMPAAAEPAATSASSDTAPTPPTPTVADTSTATDASTSTDEPAAQRTDEPAAGHTTSRFPRPPDDEDLDPEPPDHAERTSSR